MNIQTVKVASTGFLVNGAVNVPNDAGNKDYRAVQDWIAAGNTPEPEFTQQELDLAEQKSFELERVERLNETDFTQLIDENALLTQTQRSDIAAYRAQVRGATFATGFPVSPTWFSVR